MSESLVAKKVYHHRIPGACFYMPNGNSLRFSSADGSFETTDPVIQGELDKIADTPTSMIYTRQEVATAEEHIVAAEIARTATESFDTINKTPAGVQTIPMAVPSQPKPVLQVGATATPVAETQKKLEAARAAVAHAQAAKAAEATVKK